MSSFYTYLGLKFAVGFFKSGYILALFVLMNELIGASKRGVMGTIMQAIFALGIVFFACLANYIRYWRSLTLATTIIGVPVFLVGCWSLPESPRWLLSRGWKIVSYV